MKAGGFKSRKWASNDSKLLEQIPTEDCLKAIAFTLDKKDEAVKTLRIQWDADTDQLFFKVEHKDMPCTTKRQILSAIAGLYDPLGVHDARHGEKEFAGMMMHPVKYKIAGISIQES